MFGELDQLFNTNWI